MHIDGSNSDEFPPKFCYTFTLVFIVSIFGKSLTVVWTFQKSKTSQSTPPTSNHQPDWLLTRQFYRSQNTQTSLPTTTLFQRAFVSGLGLQNVNFYWTTNRESVENYWRHGSCWDVVNEFREEKRLSGSSTLTDGLQSVDSAAHYTASTVTSNGHYPLHAEKNNRTNKSRFSGVTPRSSTFKTAVVQLTGLGQIGAVAEGHNLGGRGQNGLNMRMWLATHSHQHAVVSRP